MDDSCVFCRIASGEIPARLDYEDDSTIAFHDIDPRAPVHVLIVPREHIASLNDLDDGQAATVGEMFGVAKRLARELGIADSGYRLVMNTGAHGGQSVDHIHLHLLGGRPFDWPPG